MTKVFCDVCGREINTEELWTNVYRIGMNPICTTRDLNSSFKSDMEFDYEEVCYDCASEIAANIKAMKQSS